MEMRLQKNGKKISESANEALTSYAMNNDRVCKNKIPIKENLCQWKYALQLRYTFYLMKEDTAKLRMHSV